VGRGDLVPENSRNCDWGKGKATQEKRKETIKSPLKKEENRVGPVL